MSTGTRFTSCANYNEGWCRYGDKCPTGHKPIEAGQRRKKSGRKVQNDKNVLMVPFLQCVSKEQVVPDTYELLPSLGPGPGSRPETPRSPRDPESARSPRDSDDNVNNETATMKEPHPPVEAKKVTITKSTSFKNAHPAVLPSATPTATTVDFIMKTAMAAAAVASASATDVTASVTSTPFSTATAVASPRPLSADVIITQMEASISGEDIQDIDDETTDEGLDGLAGLSCSYECDEFDYFPRIFSIVKRGIVNQVVKECIPSSRESRELICCDDLYYMLTQVMLNSEHFARVLGVEHPTKIKSAARLLKDQLLAMSRARLVKPRSPRKTRTCDNVMIDMIGSSRGTSVGSNDSNRKAAVLQAALVSIEELITVTRTFLNYFQLRGAITVTERSQSHSVKSIDRQDIAATDEPLKIKRLNSHPQQQYLPEQEGPFKETLEYPKLLGGEQNKVGPRNIFKSLSVGPSKVVVASPSTASTPTVSSPASATLESTLKSLDLLTESFAAMESMAKTRDAALAEITAGMKKVFTHLRNISVNEENCEALGVAGACELIASVVTFFVINNGPYLGTRIVELSLTIASNLAVDEENRSKLGAAGCCKIAVRALRVYGMGQSSKTLEMPPTEMLPEAVFNDAIAESAMELMRNLSTGGHSENCVAIGRVFGCETLIKAMDGYIDYDRTSALCCVALRNLCLNNEENRSRTVAGGGVDAIVSGLRIQSHSSRAVEGCCTAIHDLIASQQDLKDVFLQTGALEAVRDCLKMRGFDDDSVKAFKFSDFSGSAIYFARSALTVLL